jgi:hypothetical protein
MSKIAKKSNIAFPNQGDYKYKGHDFPKKIQFKMWFGFKIIIYSIRMIFTFRDFTLQSAGVVKILY